jgi:hypothetical protein
MLTFSAAIAMDGPYQDELGGCVRHIAQDVEDIEPHCTVDIEWWLHSARPAACQRGGGRVWTAQGNAWRAF